MPLEAVMLVVDNSESSRNGDYTPTRFDAQADAVGVIFQHVISGNPESSVGLMSSGGKGPEVLVTLTTDQGKILEGLHRTRKKINGTSHLANSLQIASLALKHRQNTTQRTRIVAFVCSPVSEDQKYLVNLAAKTKKAGIAVDFVHFGDLDDESKTKLEAFNEKVKAAEGSHLVVIPPSGNLLSDQLVSTAIFGEAAAAAAAAAAGGAGGGGGSGSGGGANDYGGFDFDPSMDPELALALRMSMEEEKARQEKRKREEAEAAAAAKQALEPVPEADESSSSQPLLDKNGEASGSGGGSGSGKAADEKKDGKPDDGDKMDTS